MLNVKYKFYIKQFSNKWYRNIEFHGHSFCLILVQITKAIKGQEFRWQISSYTWYCLLRINARAWGRIEFRTFCIVGNHFTSWAKSSSRNVIVSRITSPLTWFCCISSYTIKAESRLLTSLTYGCQVLDDVSNLIKRCKTLSVQTITTFTNFTNINIPC